MTTESMIQPIEINRVFSVSPDRLFAAWTKAEQLRRWFAPTGMTMSQAMMDLRVGGAFHYALRALTGLEMWGKWEFLEVAAPERLALVQYFSDASGGVARHPMSPTWPLRTHSVTTFAAEAGGTAMTIRWTPLQAEPVEVATFDAARPIVAQAWAGTLAQLEKFLVA